MNIVRRAVILSLLFVTSTMALRASTIFLPKPISSDLPMYPEVARGARVSGDVILWFVPNANGEVTQVGVISGNPLLREFAMSAVKSWKFKPNVLEPGVRRKTEFVYVLNVQLREGAPKLIVSMTDYRRVEVVSELYVEPIE
jgi:TonB family protein